LPGAETAGNHAAEQFSSVDWDFAPRDRIRRVARLFDRWSPLTILTQMTRLTT
jgi:hypothetical protein